MKKILVAAIRRKGQWRGAVVEDGQFKDALIVPDAFDLVTQSLSAILLTNEVLDGASLQVELTITPAEGGPSGPAAS